jgi:hypothetical protein
MYTLSEIFTFINLHAENGDLLKDYYNKCYESLKDLNKRSNLISFFILMIFALFSFSSYITEFSVLGFKINQSVVIITSPLLLSYFLLEWCLIARRRREMMKIVKQIGIFIFDIPATGADYDFRHFSLHSRNIMPFSFMIEFINVDIKSGYHVRIFRAIILLIFIAIIGYVLMALYESFRLISLRCIDLKIVISILLCNILSLICLLQIVLFYIHEFKSIKRINNADREYIEQINKSINQ